MSAEDYILHRKPVCGNARITLTLQQLRDLLTIHAGVGTEFQSAVDLHDTGLIEAFADKVGSTHMRLTPRGQAYVQHILGTPLPEALWVVPSRDSLRE